MARERGRYLRAVTAVVDSAGIRSHRPRQLRDAGSPVAAHADGLEERLVASEQQIFAQRLRHEHAIERIAMLDWKASGALGVCERDRKPGKPLRCDIASE